jgi:hypothetical protein
MPIQGVRFLASDPESSPQGAGPAPEADAYPKRGATIYAVEGAILGVVSLAWMLVRLQLSATSLADEIALMGYFVASLVNLLASTLVSDHDYSQGAHFSLCLCLWGLYAYLLVESLLTTGETAVGPDPYARIFFGSMQLFQIAAGVSYALVTLHTLLAAGAVSRRLWHQTLWVDGLIILLTGAQAALCGNAVIVVFDVLCLLFLALPLVPALDWVVASLWWRLLHLFFTLATAIVTLAVAWASRTTAACLPVFLGALVVLFLVRLLQPLPPIDLASAHDLLHPTEIVVPSAPPAREVLAPASTAAVYRAARPPQPPSPYMALATAPPLLVSETSQMSMRAFLSPPQAPRGAVLAADALLFGGGRVSKKTL